MKTVERFVIIIFLILSAAFVVLGHTTVYARDKLYPGEELRRGEYLNSDNGDFRLIMERDGNLVLFGPRRNPIWSTGTHGTPAERCVMQKDGNLVLYAPGIQPVWSSATPLRPGSFLWLQNDGNLVIYQPVWSSATAGAPPMEEPHRRDREEDRWRR